ncbi:hypothetical protein QBC41DRAFT_127023 [Cercophora samala]|uniref:Uncharacterized protein n=1 Tax=Cercophora samala TaxID=330535 RepID=A0AA40DC33_9PEZI|nr:hypothetical protein QBC41DRAFT_127023 [Cercophora samala]
MFRPRKRIALACIIEAQNLNWILSQNMLDAVTSRANPLDALPRQQQPGPAIAIWRSTRAASGRALARQARKEAYSLLLSCALEGSSSNPDSVRLAKKAVVTADCLASRHDPVLVLDEGPMGGTVMASRQPETLIMEARLEVHKARRRGEAPGDLRQHPRPQTSGPGSCLCALPNLPHIRDTRRRQRPSLATRSFLMRRPLPSSRPMRSIQETSIQEITVAQGAGQEP